MKKKPRRIVNDDPQPISIGNGVHRTASKKAEIDANKNQSENSTADKNK